MWNEPDFADACPYFINDLMEWILAKDVGIGVITLPIHVPGACAVPCRAVLVDKL